MILKRNLAVTLDCLIDRKVGIFPMRKQWPILEPIRLDGKGPLAGAKWAMLGSFVGFMILYFLLAVGNVSFLVTGADNLFEWPPAAVRGIFGGDCGGTHELIKILRAADTSKSSDEPEL